MLYVFQVDTGTMMTFDMSLAMESVQNLKKVVEQVIRIPAAEQVVLISGGEYLDPAKRVCSYSAGTDTNPIFLFRKSVVESVTPPSPSVDLGSECDLKDKLRESNDLPPVYSTVVRRTQIAQQFHELAKDLVRKCESLVHDQHLQQQGWSAVVANLEDIVCDFKKRTASFQDTFRKFMDHRGLYLNFLQQFNEVLVILQKIPLIPNLIQTKEDEVAKSDETGVGDQTESSDSKSVTLWDWIYSLDPIDRIHEHCINDLEHFNDKIFEDLQVDIDKLLETAHISTMKEVKGLGDRLFGLEQLMREAKKCMQEQSDLALAFLQNQTRAGNLKDASILPDLCESHRKQLLVMANNHQQLCDIRRRCARAKEELSGNICHRLKWVTYIENGIMEIDGRLMMYHENIQRLRMNVDILQQMHLAPAIYLSAVAEIVRRRNFSQSFLMWASELACHLLTIHNEEVTKRKEFQSQLEGHFLKCLFPGIDDMPPPFATEAPSIFDSKLPKITQEDIDRLKEQLPDELTDNLNIQESSALTFFLTKSIMRTEADKVDEATAVEEKLVQAVSDVGLSSNLDHNLLKTMESEPCLVIPHGVSHLKDLDKDLKQTQINLLSRGCESETDTEEFEKVGQSPLDLHFDKDIPSPRPGTQDVSTLTEDNLEISKSEHEKLKTVLMKMGHLAHQAVLQLRLELNDLRVQFVLLKNELQQIYSSLGSSLENLSVERDNKEKEIIDKISKDYSSEMNDFRQLAQVKNDEIKNLRGESALLEENLKKISEENELIKDTVKEYRCRIDELERQLQNSENEKERAVKEVTDRLNREHKAELENIRTRFKLMTMERSPSDTSLERIDRGEFSSLNNQETILLQLTENFELEKDKAVRESLEQERQTWEKKMADKVKELEENFAKYKQMYVDEIVQKINEEKDKQIDLLRERENHLALECLKYKNTIQQLTECETEQQNSLLAERVADLEREREVLTAELQQSRCERDMGVSVAIIEGKVDAATSPVRQRKSLTKSQTSIVKNRKLSIDSCKPGDVVLVIWDDKHESFRIFQESSYMYFVHSDCLVDLGLEVVEGAPKKPNKQYCAAEVIDKEYCHARKSENRYKVPRGTKFHRVKVKQLSESPEGVPKDALLKLHMSQSQAAPVASAISSSQEESGHKSLPSSPTTLASSPAPLASSPAPLASSPAPLATSPAPLALCMPEVIGESSAQSKGGDVSADKENECTDGSSRNEDIDSPMEDNRSRLSILNIFDFFLPDY